MGSNVSSCSLTTTPFFSSQTYPCMLSSNIDTLLPFLSTLSSTLRTTLNFRCLISDAVNSIPASTLLFARIVLMPLALKVSICSVRIYIRYGTQLPQPLIKQLTLSREIRLYLDKYLLNLPSALPQSFAYCVLYSSP